MGSDPIDRERSGTDGSFHLGFSAVHRASWLQRLIRKTPTHSVNTIALEPRFLERRTYHDDETCIYLAGVDLGGSLWRRWLWRNHWPPRRKPPCSRRRNLRNEQCLQSGVEIDNGRYHVNLDMEYMLRWWHLWSDDVRCSQREVRRRNYFGDAGAGIVQQNIQHCRHVSLPLCRTRRLHGGDRHRPVRTPRFATNSWSFSARVIGSRAGDPQPPPLSSSARVGSWP